MSQEFEYFIFVFCTLMLCIAGLKIPDLKNCQEESHESLICLTDEKGYFNPFPVIVDSELVLRKIIEIDENKNSISAQFELMTWWLDPGITLSNNPSE